MNYITAQLLDVKASKQMHFLHCYSGQHQLHLIVLGLNEGVKVGSQVVLGVKSTNVSFAKGKDTHISISTQLEAVVKHIHCGELVCEVELDLGEFTLMSIIMKEVAEKMSLQIGDEVLALIKATDLSIVEVKGA